MIPVPENKKKIITKKRQEKEIRIAFNLFEHVRACILNHEVHKKILNNSCVCSQYINYRIIGDYKIKNSISLSDMHSFDPIILG
jgi:hypothetical protein